MRQRTLFLLLLVLFVCSAKGHINPFLGFDKKEEIWIKKHSILLGCHSDEILIASCSILKTELIRFCFNLKTERISFFLKKENQPELTIKFDKNNTLKRWVDLGTYTTYFGFKEGAYSYILGVPEERPNARAFFDIEQNGQTVDSKECNDNSFGIKHIKTESVEDILDSSVRENSFKFP